MPRRFPNEIHLEDYTPEQLAQIARKVAADKFDLDFEAGLEESLAVRVSRTLLSDSPLGLFSLTRSLTVTVTWFLPLGSYQSQPRTASCTA